VRQIEIVGIGPHQAATTLPLPHNAEGRGALIIAGPSQSGKSTVAAALCYLLTGAAPDGSTIDPAALSADAGSVRVSADDGRIFELRISRSGRKVWKCGEETITAAKDRWRILGPLGLDSVASLVAGIVCPLALLRQAEDGQGRLLRATLTAALPERSLDKALAELLGTFAPALPGDAVDTRGAVQATTRATAARDRALGALDGAQAAQQRHEEQGAPTVPDQSATAAARAVVEAGEAWAAFRRTGGAGERRAQQQAALADWRRRMAEIPPAQAFDGAPPPKVPSLRTEEAAVAQAQAELDRLPKSPADAAPGVHEKRLAAATRWSALPTASCDLCGQVVPPPRIAQVAATARVQIEAERKTAQDLVDAARRRAQEQLAKAQEQLKVAQERAERAQAELEGYRAEAEARKLRNAAVAALGPEPTVDPEPTGAPATPAAVEPAAEEVTRARALLSRASQAAADLRAYEARTTTLSEDIGLAADALKAREAELARARAVEAAHKGAPARVLEQQLVDWRPAAKMLASQGVEIRIRPAGEVDGLDLMIDGLPSYLASTGRRVHASALLAYALRTLAARRHPQRGGIGGFADLPICIDDAQSWSGGNYPSQGPLLWLLTEPSEEAGPAAIATHWQRL
jgi:exonuclease SbcC